MNAAEFGGHPIAAELARHQSQDSNKAAQGLKKFETTVERVYTSDLYAQCQRGLDRKETLKSREVGIFGIGTDWEEVRRIEQEPVEACEELRRLGLMK